MTHRQLRFLPILGCLAAILLAAGPSWAQIISANGTPPVNQLVRPVVLGDDALSFPVTWQIGVAPVPPDQTASVTIGVGIVTTTISRSSAVGSSRGRFVLDTGSVRELMEVGGLPVVEAAPGAVFTETVVLPPAVIEEARRRGAQRILFVRDFDEARTARTETVNTFFSGAPTTRSETTAIESTSRRSAAVAFYLTPGIGGDVSVFRVALRFDEGETLKFARPGDELRVWADVFYRGVGRIEGLWEVADPASTSGTPIFRPVERVVRLLGAGQRLSLRGPRLPTTTSGLHIVRFRFTGAADPAFADPVIRYQVMADLPGVAPAVARTIALRGPVGATELRDDTTFAWGRVDGSAAYQLELFERSTDLLDEGIGRRFDDESERFQNVTLGAEPTPFEPTARAAEASDFQAGERLAGVLLPPDALETSLDALTRGHLTPGTQVLWRVVAFAPDGRRIGESELRPLRVPGVPAATAP